MSYEFTLNAATKDELRAKLSAQFDAIVSEHGLEDVDRKHAEAIANSNIDMAIDDGSGFVLRMSGTADVPTDGEPMDRLTGANLVINVHSVI